KKWRGLSLSWMSSTSRLSIISAPSSAASASTFCGRAGGASDADSAMRMTSAMTRLLRSCGPTSSKNKHSTFVDNRCTNRAGVRRKSQKRETALIHRNNRRKIDAFEPSRYALAMAILSDRSIREQALNSAMIEPFVEAQRREGCISYGLSSYGYDARVADEFKIFTNVDSATVDPKDFASNSFVDRKTDVCIIPPNSFALARTVEYFRVPRDVLVICLGKST